MPVRASYGPRTEIFIFFISYGTRTGPVRDPQEFRTAAFRKRKGIDTNRIGKIPHGRRIWPYGARTGPLRAPQGLFTGCLQYLNPYGACKLIVHALKLYGPRTHWGQPREATVVKMAPTRPLASRSFCLLAAFCDHRSLSNLQRSNTRAWYTLHQNDRLVPCLIFVQ